MRKEDKGGNRTFVWGRLMERKNMLEKPEERKIIET